MKKFILTILTLLFSQAVSLCEEIHFDNEIYKLKFSAPAPATGGWGNEYYKNNEDISDWTKMIGIYHYPKEDNPVKYAQNFDNIVENTDNSMLLKLIENKKTDKAVISFLVNGCENEKKFFEYDVYKFEKHPTKGMLVSKYAVKHFFNSDEEISSLASDIKKNNDKYLEMLIVSPAPTVIEKDITFTN